MAGASGTILPPAPLKEQGNLADNWREWRQNFEIYLTAVGIDSRNDRVRCEHFLHTIGQYGRDIFNCLEISKSECSLKEYMAKFESYCNPKRNLIINRYEFFKIKQDINENFDKFLQSIRQKSSNCEFGDLNDNLIALQIISGISNSKLREHFLRMPDLDLYQVIEECRATEAAETQTEKISTTIQETDHKKQPKANPQNETPTDRVISQTAAPPTAVEKKQPHASSGQKSDNFKLQQELQEQVKRHTERPSVRIINCGFCGCSHIYGHCPAYGKVCNKCSKPNHFARVCRTQVQRDPSPPGCCTVL